MTRDVAGYLCPMFIVVLSWCAVLCSFVLLLLLLLLLLPSQAIHWRTCVRNKAAIFSMEPLYGLHSLAYFFKLEPWNSANMTLPGSSWSHFIGVPDRYDTIISATSNSKWSFKLIPMLLVLQFRYGCMCSLGHPKHVVGAFGLHHMQNMRLRPITLYVCLQLVDSEKCSTRIRTNGNRIRRDQHLGLDRIHYRRDRFAGLSAKHSCRSHTLLVCLVGTASKQKQVITGLYKWA